MGLMWPTRITKNPSFVQIIARIIHWVGAFVGIYFIGDMLFYLYKASGTPDWTEVSKRVVLGAGIFLGARAFRFIIAQE